MNRFQSTKTKLVLLLLCSSLMSACQSNTLRKDPEQSVKVRTQLAAEYIRKGDLDAAKRSLDLALELDKNDPAANMMMGVLLQQEGSALNLEKADQFFRRSLSKDGNNAQARNNYGTYLFQMKRYPDAVKQFAIAAATLGYDQRARAAENLGRTYLKMNNTAQAETAFKQALTADRNSNIALLELAEIYYLRKDMSVAADIMGQYQRNIGLNQFGSRALWAAIRIWRANNDELQMKQALNALRAQFPDSSEYQLYLKLKDSKEAVWK